MTDLSAKRLIKLAVASAKCRTNLTNASAKG